MSRSRYILSNTLSSYGRDIVDTVVFLGLTPFLIQTLGREDFGLWSLVWGLLSLFTLMDLGLGNTVIKCVAEARGRGDPEAHRRTICAMFWLYAGVAVLLIAAVSVSTTFLNQLLSIPEKSREAARVLVIVLGVRMAVCLPLELFRGILIAHQRLAITNAYKAAGTVLYLVMTLVALGLAPDVRWLAVSNTVTGVLPMLAMMVHVLRTVPDISFDPRLLRRSDLASVWSMTCSFSLIRVSSLLYARIDSILLSRMVGLGAVAQYSIGFRLSERAYLFSTHLSRALTPVMAEIQGRGDTRDMSHILYRGAKLTTAFATPFLIGLAILAGPLIEVWAGPGFEEAIPACQLLLAGSMIMVVHASSANYLAMSGHERFLAVANLVAQVVHLGFSLLLIGPWGVQGVAMASLLATAPLYLLVVQTRVNHLEGVGPLHYYRETVGPSVIPALLMGLPLHIFARSDAITSIVHVALAEVVGLAIFFAAFWTTGLEDRERGFLGARIRDALRRFQSAFQGLVMKT